MPTRVIMIEFNSEATSEQMEVFQQELKAVAERRDGSLELVDDLGAFLGADQFGVLAGDAPGFLGGEGAEIEVRRRGDRFVVSKARL